MPDYNAFVKVMKQAGIEATNAGGPVTVCFGRVVNTAPLQVLVDQKMTLGTAQLVLTRNVTDYEVEVTIGSEEKKKMMVHNSLKNGDDLVLIRQQGGQKYIVIDRVGKK